MRFTYEVLKEARTAPSDVGWRRSRAPLYPNRGKARLFKWVRGVPLSIEGTRGRNAVAMGIGRDVWWSPDVIIHAQLYDELILQGKIREEDPPGPHYLINKYSGDLMMSD